jgi:hypothetical protein
MKTLYFICLIWNVCVMTAAVVLIIKCDSAWWALTAVLVAWPDANDVKGITIAAKREVRNARRDSAS